MTNWGCGFVAIVLTALFLLIPNSQASSTGAIHESSPQQNKQSSTAQDYFPPDRYSFDWVCEHRNGEILYNSKNLTTALTLSVGDLSVVTMNTLLVETDNSCENCYYITTELSSTHDGYYVLHFRKNSDDQLIVDMNEYLNNDEYVPIVSSVPCVKSDSPRFSSSL